MTRSSNSRAAQAWLSFWRWPGGVALGLLLLIIILPLLALLTASKMRLSLGAADLAALRFTLLQASLSTLLALLVGTLLARALLRRDFPFRAAMMRLLALPFVMPAIIAVQAVIAIWGGGGMVSMALVRLGFDPLDIYGLQGILLANLFYNIPFVALILLAMYGAIPAEKIALTRALDLSARSWHYVIERPILARALLPLAALIFLYCSASFVIALTLGGGPLATTLEVAIYEAIRFEFDLPRAALLALMQLLIALMAGMAALWLRPDWRGMSGLGGHFPEVLRLSEFHTPLTRLQDGLILILSLILLAGPLVGYLGIALPGLLDLPLVPLWRATMLSLLIVLGSCLLALLLAFILSSLVTSLNFMDKSWMARLVELAGFLPMALSPLALGVGIFYLLRHVVSPSAIAIELTIMMNALLLQPLLLRILIPAMEQAQQRYARLVAMTGLRPWVRLMVVELPLCWPALRLAGGLSAIFALGDLGIFALVAPAGLYNLPLLIYQQMGAYRMEAAAATGLVMMLLAALLFLFIAGGRRDQI